MQWQAEARWSELNEEKKERGTVHMRTHEGEIRAASWHLHMYQLNSLQVIPSIKECT